MPERYLKLYSLAENLYIDGAPVIISAGALLKDNNTGKILTQLKIKSITDKTIKAVKVCVMAHDTIGRIIGEPILHQYLDLSVKRDEEFGQKTAIYMPDDSTREFKVAITEVAFADNTVWAEAADKEWKALPELKALLPDNKELLKQYRIEINKNAKIEFCEADGLWFCACGSINDVGEEKCHRCGTILSSMKNCDFNSLKEKCDERVKKEKEGEKDFILKKAISFVDNEDYEAALEQFRLISGWRDADERAAMCKDTIEKMHIAANKKKKKTKRIGIGAIVAIVMCAVLALLTVKVFIPLHTYNSAISLIEKGKYDEAREIFESLGTFKDSERMCNESLYLKARQFMEKGEFEKAKDIFESLGDFKDSEKMRKESLCLEAERFLKNGELEEAKKCYMLAGESDSAKEIDYDYALKEYEKGEFFHAYSLFVGCGKYKDAEEKSKEALKAKCNQDYLECIEKGNLIGAIKVLNNAAVYNESSEKIEDCCKMMYEYVLSKKGHPDLKSFDYLHFLRGRDYKDSVKLFETIFEIDIKVENGDVMFCAGFDIGKAIRFELEDKFMGHTLQYEKHTIKNYAVNEWVYVCEYYYGYNNYDSFDSIKAYIDDILITTYQK